MEKACIVCGSTYKCQNYKGKDTYCNKHYLQMNRYGKIKERTKFDKNEIVLKEDYAEIMLYNNECEIIDKAFIDLDDVDKIKDIKWYKGTRGYVQNIKGKGTSRICLHRYITNCPRDLVVDHINHNVLDNRKNNLKVCTQKENCNNRL